MEKNKLAAIIIFCSICIFITYRVDNEKVFAIQETTKNKTYYHNIIEIPKIHLFLPIVFSNQISEYGVTSIENESHQVLAAHSGNSNVSFFKEIDKLNIGDAIHIYKDNKMVVYRIIEKQLVKEDNLGVLYDKDNIITLITCDKIQNDQRLIIKAKIETK